MTYKEDYSDNAFIDALGNDNKDIRSIAEIVGCSHQLAKLRLNRLVMEGRVIKDTENSGGRDGFRYVYALNKKFKEPEGGFMYLNPKKINQTAGVLFWYRSIDIRLQPYNDFKAACEKIIELSGAELENVEITDEHVKFTGKGIESDKGLFFVPRIQNNLTNTLKSDKVTRVFGYCKTDNKPYNVAVIACLVALRETSHKTTLQFNCDYEMIREGILLAEKVFGAIDRKFLFSGTVKFPKVGKVQDVV